MNDCANNFHRLQMQDFASGQDLQRQNMEHLRTEILSHICAEIETFLRLEVHLNLNIIESTKNDPNNMNMLLKCEEYKQWIRSCPLPLNQSYISIGHRIENYLSVMFYNLTTISLHDWKTYEEMRHLAEKRFQIHALEDYLPNQSLDQVIPFFYSHSLNVFWYNCYYFILGHRYIGNNA